MAITITQPTNVQAGTPFTLAGTLTGYSSAPKLSYVDDPVVAPVTNLRSTATTKTSVSLAWTAPPAIPWAGLPSGSTVTTSGFSFTHPAIAAGSHVTDVGDGNIAAKTGYTVGSGSTVTHNTVIAQLQNIQKLLDQAIADVGKLSP